MTVYSYAELEQLWIQAGGPRALAPLAAAIGEAESGGNSDALNPNDNGGTQSSFGIWQISNGTHTPPSPNWANPAVNAQLAVGKWRGAGQSFSPWGTYTSGAYKAFLSGKIPPAANVPGSPTQNATTMAYQASVDCLVGNPFSASIGIGGFSVGGSVGPSCLFTKSNARAFIGAGLMAGGFVMAFSGGMWVMAGAALKAFGGLPSGINILIPIPKQGRNPQYPLGANPAAGNNVPGPGSPGPGGPPAYASTGAAQLRQAPKVIPGEVISSTTAAAGELGAAPLALAAA